MRVRAYVHACIPALCTACAVGRALWWRMLRRGSSSICSGTKRKSLLFCSRGMALLLHLQVEGTRCVCVCLCVHLWLCFASSTFPNQTLHLSASSSLHQLHTHIQRATSGLRCACGMRRREPASIGLCTTSLLWLRLRFRSTTASCCLLDTIKTQAWYGGMMKENERLEEGGGGEVGWERGRYGLPWLHVFTALLSHPS